MRGWTTGTGSAAAAPALSRRRFAAAGALALVLIGAVLVPSAVRDDEIDTTTRRRATTTTAAPVGVLNDVLADAPAQAVAEPPAGVRRAGGGRRVAAPRSAATGTPAAGQLKTPPGGSAPTLPPAPNGRIAFSMDAGDKPEILTVLPDGTGLRRLTTGHAPRWSPDGSMLALEDGAPLSSLFVVAADGGNRRQLTYDNLAYDAQWSPAGDEIAFLAVRPTGTPRATYSPVMPVVPGFDGDINVVKVTTGAVRPVTAGPDVDYEPAWSPDGREIAFQRAQADASGGYAEAVYAASGLGAVRRLWTPPESWYLTGTSWAPGRGVAVTAGYGGRGQGVWLVSSDGSARELARGGAEWQDPQWSPTGDAVLVRTLNGTGFAAVTLDGRILFEREGNAAAWSYDGAQVAFLAGDALWRMNRDGTSVVRLVEGIRNNGINPSISWSRPTP